MLRVKKQHQTIFFLTLLAGCAIFFIASFLFPESASALIPDSIVPQCNWYGDSAGNNKETYGLGAFIVLASNIMKLIWGITGSLALLMFVWGGFLWLTAAGEESRVKAGWDTFVNATIGIGIVLGSWVIINTVILFLVSPPGTFTEATLFNGKTWVDIATENNKVCIKSAELARGSVPTLPAAPTPVASSISTSRDCLASTGLLDAFCHATDCPCKASGLICKKSPDDGLNHCLTDTTATAACSPACDATHYCHDARYGFDPKTGIPPCRDKLTERRTCIQPEQCASGLTCRVAPGGGFQCLAVLLSPGPITPPPSACVACSATQYCHDNTFVPPPTAEGCVDKLVVNTICQKPIQCATGLECKNDNAGVKRCLGITAPKQGICLLIFKDQATDLFQQYSIQQNTAPDCGNSPEPFGKVTVSKQWCLPVIDIIQAMGSCNRDPGNCSRTLCSGGWQNY